MGSIISPPKPKGPDPELVAAQREQMIEEKARAAELEAQTAARRRALAGRAGGRVQLLGGLETGLKETLG